LNNAFLPFDGFLIRRGGLRCAESLVTAAYPHVHLPPQDLLNLESSIITMD
jgi:hypothetical protein